MITHIVRYTTELVVHHSSTTSMVTSHATEFYHYLVGRLCSLITECDYEDMVLGRLYG